MSLIDVLAIISLVIFYGLFLGRTIILHKTGVKVWVIGTSTKKSSEKILEYILFPALVLWAVFVIFTALHINLPIIALNYLINIVWLRYIGIIVCFIGLIIFLLALISFGKSWRIGIDENNSNELITTGMFKYSRNPVFLFMDLYFIGIMLVYPNVIFMIIAICTIIGIHLQILREEKFLLKKFGDKYMEYKKQTRRYV
jgi:protein-S-isoprenylcysteine O-methyltransferase Ste14